MNTLIEILENIHSASFYLGYLFCLFLTAIFAISDFFIKWAFKERAKLKQYEKCIKCKKFLICDTLDDLDEDEK